MRAIIFWMLLGLLSSHTALAAKTVTIGIVTDSDYEQAVVPAELIKEEMQTLMAGEFDLVFPPEKRLNGAGSVSGIHKALQAQLNDTQVDLIIVLGIVASQQAGQLPELNKPIIAAWVLDQQLQGLPYQNGTSGKHNFTYLTTARNIPEEIAYFKDMVGFKHLAVLINPFWLNTLPELRQIITAIESKQNITIDIIPASKDIHKTLKQLPPQTDAVYVAPLADYSDENIRTLASGFIARGLPSFSAIGRHDVELGLLAAKGGMPEDKIRFARRVALDVQSILLGEEAGDLNVMFMDNAKLILNMKTAQALGYSPPWRYMLDAVLLNQEHLIPKKKLALQTAMQTALQANLQLQVNELFVAVAEDNVDLARANLLPQLFVEIDNQQVDSNDPLAKIGVAENMTTAIIGGQQSLYSDSFWANFRIAEYLEDAEDYKLYGQILDTLADTGVGYLNVLRAIAVQEVRRANLNVTDAHLDLARMRERVGFSTRADVLRWESQLARDQQLLLEASSLVSQMQTELNRLLNLPQDEFFLVSDDQLGQFATLLNEPILNKYVGNAYQWKLFQQFAVEETLQNAPELGEIDSMTQAKERERLASQRSFYVPDFNLEGGLVQTLSTAGTGSNFAAEGISDTQWQINVNATLPLLTGGAQIAKLSQTGYEVAQLELQNRATQEQLEKRTRDIVYQIGESYPAIELSNQASRAAAENLGLVADRYEHGTVDIVDLIDAQNNALSAQLDSAQARYVFLTDFITLLRSTGDLMLALDNNSLPHWFGRIDHFYEEAE